MRLIDADRLVESVHAYGVRGAGWSDGERESDVCDMIDDQPTIKAEPVVHGRWTMNSDRPDTIVCEICDRGFDVWKHEAKDFNRCPHCGAHMSTYE